MKKIIFIGYFVTVIALFFYSYTQIDLGLTFSRIEFLRSLVKSFQYIGYFNRPLSTFIFVLLIVFLFNFYLCFLIMVLTKQLGKKTIWKLIIATTVILAFSYNAFSYDLFNYIFDAKIVAHYHLNPYEHKALDFQGDPMLSYMHWTHRVYPYGPVWLILTVPLSFFGFNLFIPTFVLFKLLMALGFLGTTFYIGKILEKALPKNYLWGITFFAFNPLVIIECLISAHVDIVMLFFAIWSFYQIINKRYISAYGLLIISVGIKFATAALVPIYLLINYLRFKNKKINWSNIFYVSFVLMIISVLFIVQRTNNYQPWYLLEVLFIGALISYRYFIFIPLVIISFFSLLNYVPYLYLGNWNPPVPEVLNGINLFSILISIISILVFSIFKRKSKIKDQKSKLKLKA